MATPEEITLNQILDALLDVDTPFQPKYLYSFSDMSQKDLSDLDKTWPKIQAWRRRALMEDIEELGESNYTLSFEAISRYCMQDRDPRVREIAIRTLWEYDSPDLVPIFLDMTANDQDAGVRANAAAALGKYVYLGEIDELSRKTLEMIEKKLLNVISGSDTTLVRRRALESLGFSGLEEVSPIIENAYYSGNINWIISALSAMGRSANRGWSRLVVQMLEHENPEVCSEAARATGELEISQAVPQLIELLDNSDEEVRLAAVWSLSQIGGEGVKDMLEQMYHKTGDEEEAQLIEAALENLAFTEDFQLFTLMDIVEEGEEIDSINILEDNEDYLN